MHSREVKKSVLVKVSALIASVLILAGCATGAVPAASPTSAAGGTARPTAGAETTTTSEAMTPETTTTSGAMTPETTTTSEAMTPETTTTPEAMTTPGAGTAANALVQVADNPTLGTILVDSNGMTLYVFDNDTSGTSNCTGDCLQRWPALTVADEDEEITTGEGVTAELAVITRDDGTYQVTANGMPLYTYAEDAAPGDVNGQGVGEVWWVVGPDGTKITQQ
jgi:predicted lipoprotein with Yx(FWY)xxD motif